MNFTNAFQLKYFGVFLLLGAALGIFCGLIHILLIIKNNLSMQIVSDLVLTLTGFMVFWLYISTYNQGEFRLYQLLGFMIGFTIERTTLGKLFAKGYKFVYTKLVKMVKNFKESNLGKVIFK